LDVLANYMNKLLQVIIPVLMLTGCQDQDGDHDPQSGDDMIYPDTELQPARWERLDSLTNLSLSDIHFCNENTGIIGGFDGTVYITCNGGQIWQTIEDIVPMTFHCVYALDGNTFLAGRTELFKSTDGGTTWTSAPSPPVATIFDIWFKDQLTGFLATSGGTYRTVDSGRDKSFRCK